VIGVEGEQRCVILQGKRWCAKSNGITSLLSLSLHQLDLEG
jgi:hypothetical protein